MTSKVLETERLRLRQMDMSDKDNLLLIFQDPIAMRFYPSIKNTEETVRWITWNVNNYHKFHVGLWIVEDRSTGMFLGQCGLVPRKHDGAVQMELGYLFVRNEWGYGFATEAANACIEYGFHVLKVPKIITQIDPNNDASLRVANKIGMTYEQTVEKWGKEMHVYLIVNSK